MALQCRRHPRVKVKDTQLRDDSDERCNWARRPRMSVHWLARVVIVVVVVMVGWIYGSIHNSTEYSPTDADFDHR